MKLREGGRVWVRSRHGETVMPASIHEIRRLPMAALAPFA